MVQMRKLDSFMKESQRLSGLGSCTFNDWRSCFRILFLTSRTIVVMNRMALKDFTFSNGTVVPAGTIVGVASYGMHHDEVSSTSKG